LAGYQRGRELHDLHRRLAEVEKDIARTKTALKEGVPNPRTRANEVERLEALTREAEQLELRIQEAERR
jgi:ribosomal protein L29